MSSNDFSNSFFECVDIMNQSSGHKVADMSWYQLQQCMTDDSLAVLPIGAASKEHGYHLPLNNDYLIAEWWAERIMEETSKALVWPTVNYGYYPAFIDFPGSCTLSEATFQQLIQEIAGSILHSGIRQLLVINTGVSTIKPLENAIEQADLRDRVWLWHSVRGEHYQAAAKRLSEQKFGSHADELETSKMLIIAPQAVDMSKTQAIPEKAFDFQYELLISRTDPEHPNYSPSGVYGDPTLASVEKGRKLLEAQQKDLTMLLSDIFSR